MLSARANGMSEELNKLLFHLEQQNAVIDTARRAAINGAHEMSVMLLVQTEWMSSSSGM